MVIRSDSESIFQQQFRKNHGNNGCNSLNILTAAQSFGSYDYYSKSLMMIFGLASRHR